MNGAKKHSERKRFWTHGLPGQHKEEQNACEDEDPRKREHSSYRAFRCTPGVIAVVGSRDREELGFHFQGMPPIGQLTFTGENFAVLYRRPCAAHGPETALMLFVPQ